MWETNKPQKAHFQQHTEPQPGDDGATSVKAEQEVSHMVNKAQIPYSSLREQTLPSH